MILNVKRLKDDSKEIDNEDHLEAWPKFLKRTEEKTDEQLEKAGLTEWNVQCRARKWRWAQQLLEQGHGKRSQVATLWQPQLHTARQTARKKERPKRRWAQDLDDFVHKAFPDEGKSWRVCAQDKEWWKANEKDFAQPKAPSS